MRRLKKSYLLGAGLIGLAVVVGLVSWYGLELKKEKKEALPPFNPNLVQKRTLPTDVPPQMREKILKGEPFKTDRVTIGSQGFQPSFIKIKVGDRVTWLNQTKENHQIKEEKERWESKVIKPGESFTQVFDVTGTFNYLDPSHPQFKGTVMVEE